MKILPMTGHITDFILEGRILRYMKTHKIILWWILILGLRGPERSWANQHRVANPLEKIQSGLVYTNFQMPTGHYELQYKIKES